MTSDPIEQSVLLTSLILALDKVDNTMGHQVAYLKMGVQKPSNHDPQISTTCSTAALPVVSAVSLTLRTDLVYLDPPYGTNNPVTKTTRVRYRTYYHIWTTICRNDQPSVHGAAARRQDASSDRIPGALSIFESTKTDAVHEATARLLAKLNCRYILFSYNNKGKLSPQALQALFSPYKTLAFLSFDHKEHAMKKPPSTRPGSRSGRNQEFLILVEKGQPLA